MKKLILTLLIAFPLICHAEYNGVHLMIKVELENGNTTVGYRYIAHGNTSDAYKKQLEGNPRQLLLNQFTNEPGEYGFYQERLAYLYKGSILYKLINPVEIKIEKIKSINILELTMASYAIQISGDYHLKDQSWMKTKPIISFSEYEDLCSFEIFIHADSENSADLQAEIKSIVNEAKKKETELDIPEDYNELYESKIQDIHEERSHKILQLIEKNKELKTITITICTC